MAARLVTSPAPSRRREPVSAEKLPKQRSLKEFGVILRPASSDTDLTPPSVNASVKRKYGARWTCGTFAGRRPPKDEDKLKQFLKDHSEHKQRMQELPKGQKRQATDAQQHYRDFVKARLPHEKGGPAKQRLISVAAQWKQQLTVPDKLAQENRSVV